MSKIQGYYLYNINSNLSEDSNCFCCQYCGDLPFSDEHDCLYALDPDIDEDGFVIHEPPCQR